MKSSQHCNLSGVSHCVRQGALKKLLIAYRRGQRLVAEICEKSAKRLVKAVNFVVKIVESGRGERSSVDHCSRIAHQARHVPDELARSSHPVAGAEISEVVRRSAKRLLRAICECGEEVPEQPPRFRHLLAAAAQAPSRARSPAVMCVLFPGGIVPVT